MQKINKLKLGEIKDSFYLSQQIPGKAENHQILHQLFQKEDKILRKKFNLQLYDIGEFNNQNHYYQNLMNLLKSQAYSLSPEQYLRKFQIPHEVISLKGTQNLDEKDRQILQEILEKSYNDSHQTGQLKQKASEQLTNIVQKWMNENCNQQLPQQYGLKIFGSYSLKAHSFDGDIDMICIVPENFSREKHFFGILVDILKANEQVRQISPIPDAYVPIIKLTYYGVQIDLLMARIPFAYLSQHPNLLKDINQFPISDKQLKCMNGYRTSLYLKKNIKKYSNFQAALKTIKFWARNKGIYSQNYSYLGGAAYSIMLAKICQLYPNYSALQLLDRFFLIYSNWVWSVPIMLEKIQYPQSIQDQMTIYTPFEPFINAAHGVTKITSFITKKHLKAASQLIQQINKGKKTWRDLFTPVNFFEQYRYFLEISVMGQNQQDFLPWKGNIQSKFRKFIKFFEMQQDFPQGIQLNPYPRAFESTYPNYKICVKYFIGIKASSSSPLNDFCDIDFSQPVKDFLNVLQAYPHIDKAPKIVNIGFGCVPKENIDPQILADLKPYE